MINWRAFELRPEGVPPLDPNGEYIQNAWKNSVLPLSQQMGVEMKMPPVQPRTRLAHEAMAHAKAMGQQQAMAEALFKAYFQQGRDVGQVEVLCDIALSVGLDPVELRGHLEERTYRSQVEQDLALGQRLQISAVPTFIVGDRFMLRGLVSEEHLKRAIDMCKGEGLINLE